MTNRLACFLIAAAAALPAQPPACPGFENCLYTANQTYQVARQTLRISYTDVAGLTRILEVTARIPNRPGPLPVVIWQHGGGEGRWDSVGALDDWGIFTSARGYLSVNGGFHARTEAEHQALCTHLGLDADGCASFHSLSFDRPYDVKAILDALEDANRQGPLRNRIDLDRIAAAGHSAGSSGTLSVAGAARLMAGKRFGPDQFGDTRIKAAIGLSPSVPGASFMFDTSFQDPTTSWDTVRGPVLTVTGSGDAHEQYPRGRRVPFEYMKPGDKYRLWVNDDAFGHDDYGDEITRCGTNVTKAKCEAFSAAVQSVVLAFLDAYIEKRGNAMNYLRGEAITELGRGVLEWSRK